MTDDQNGRFLSTSLSKFKIVEFRSGSAHKWNQIAIANDRYEHSFTVRDRTSSCEQCFRTSLEFLLGWGHRKFSVCSLDHYPTYLILLSRQKILLNRNLGIQQNAYDVVYMHANSHHRL